jgi:hypothetical protein
VEVRLHAFYTSNGGEQLHSPVSSDPRGKDIGNGGGGNAVYHFIKLIVHSQKPVTGNIKIRIKMTSNNSIERTLKKLTGRQLVTKFLSEDCLLCSEKPATEPYPEQRILPSLKPCATFLQLGLLNLRPLHKLEHHHLSIVGIFLCVSDYRRGLDW